MKKILILLLLLMSLSSVEAADKSDNMKPRWMVASLPKPKSPNYIFISAQGIGSSLDAARQMAFVNLTTKLEHERGLIIDSKLQVESSFSRQSGYNRNQQFSLEATEKGKEINLICRVIDEYWEQKKEQYVVNVLYTVSDSNTFGSGSYEDNIRLTTSYGALPMLYSIIPGVGQFYKGSYVKGGVIMGGTVVGAVAVVLCENQRADYAKKMKEKPQNHDFYRNKKSQWTTGRNVAIGATTALYIYNLVDALVAPGRRHVVIKNRSYTYGLNPYIIDDSLGLTFSLNL